MKSVDPIRIPIRSSVARILLLGVLGALARGEVPKPAVAFPLDVSREIRDTTKAAPSSALDASSALVAARLIAGQIEGANVLTVMPTGSMRPMFDEKAFLVVEPMPYENLEVGDIVTYLHPKFGITVVHRIVEKHEGFYCTKGDHNSRLDEFSVTPKNYLMRVVAVIYAREDSRNVNRPVPAATLAMAE